MDTQEARALYELQLELHSLAMGTRPLITADELVELQAMMARHSGDFKDLVAYHLAEAVVVLPPVLALRAV